MNKHLLAIATLFFAMTSVVAQTTIGYTNGKLNKNDIVRFGTSEKQGMAFYVDAEKAAILKGASVESFLTYVSTTQITSGTFFITKELGGTPICELSFKPSSSREKMYEYPLANAFVLDGEPFYVGHLVEVATSYKPLSFDLSSNFEAGISWAYKDGEWMDVSHQGFGAPNIQIKVSGVEPFLDLMVKPIIPVGYQVAGKAQVFSGQVFNFGTETITSFDLTCKVGNAAPVTSHVSGVSLPNGASYDFTLPEYLTNESGTLDLEVEVTNVNGVMEAEVTDNVAKSSVFFYPVGVEKKILVEVFTGQACGNCPAGHANLASAMKGIEDEFIEVAHHAGYFPDQFTMEESYSYTWLYGTAGTFAPGAMFNRSLINDISTTSVVFETTSAPYTRTAVQAFRNTQPYVDIKMYNEIDETTRTGKVSIDVHTYVVPSDQMHTLNVWFVQDGLVAMQASGGSEYTHNHVFRGTLNNSAWGQQILLNAGETRRYTFEYTIPESIAATYGTYIGNAFEAVLSNMQIVAFVSDFSESYPTACNVYNAAKIPVTTNNMAHGVEETIVDCAPLFTYDGTQVHIVGDFPQVEFYTTSGTLVGHLKQGEHAFTLPAGFYVVRTKLPSGGIDVQKLLVK